MRRDRFSLESFIPAESNRDLIDVSSDHARIRARQHRGGIVVGPQASQSAARTQNTALQKRMRSMTFTSLVSSM
jgi:hypothetical protein